MENKYLEVKITVPEEFYEILIVVLSDEGYDSFQEHDSHLSAFIEIVEFDKKHLTSILANYQDLFSTTIETEELENKNWNEEWEKNFDPVFVDDKCVIKATFHTIDKSYPYEITINPRMSFGTGHHATTALMISHEMSMNFKDKIIFDAGTGTGVLAVMAKKLGAKEIHSCDIDEWSFDNCQENYALNDCSDIKIEQSTFPQYTQHNSLYDIVLANINKNVLLEEIKFYSARLAKNGYLVLSGFYTQDISDIEKEASSHNLKLIDQKDRENWAALLFEKEA